jgi:hypothetical protein
MFFETMPILSMKHKSLFSTVIGWVKFSLHLNTDAELASLLHLSPKSFSNRRTSGSIPFEPLIALLTTEKVDLRWIFTSEGNDQAKRDAAAAATQLALPYSSVCSTLLEDMEALSLVEHLNPTQLMERFRHRMPDAPTNTPDELTLLDFFRTVDELEKSAILRHAAAVAHSAKLREVGAMQAVSAEERSLLTKFRNASAQQRQIILGTAKHDQGTNGKRPQKICY